MVKISALPADSAPTSTDYIIVNDVETGATKKVLLSDLAPILFSTWTSYTPTGNVGWSGTPTTAGTGYIKIGRTVIYSIYITGTSNSTDTRITLPFTAKSRDSSGFNTETSTGLITNNGSVDSTPGPLS